MPLGFFAQARLGQRIPEEKKMSETQTIAEIEAGGSHAIITDDEMRMVIEKHRQHLLHMAFEAITPACPKCESHRGQWRGYRQLKNSTASIHRRCCTTCGRWYGYKTSMR
jgi:hypothetical protein